MIKKIFLFSFFITAVHPSFANSNASLEKSLRNLVERTTYGSSFEDIKIAKEKGYSAYLDYILNPNEINDSEFEAKYLDKKSPNYRDPHQIDNYFQTNTSFWALQHMAFSKKQFNEIMTQFWENHFNTDSSKQINLWYCDNCIGYNINRGGSLRTFSKVKNINLIANTSNFSYNTNEFDSCEITLKIKATLVPKLKLRFKITGKDSEDDYDAWLSSSDFYPIKIQKINGSKFITLRVDLNKESLKGPLEAVAINFSNNQKNRIISTIQSVKLQSLSKPELNTNLMFNNNDSEIEENMFFRENALGNFTDLLKYSAQSPSMLTYLDNWSSNKDNPNENYGRELLELHTLGVDGGYVQKDVVSAAALLTGWTIRDNKFHFNALGHDDSNQKFTFLSAPIDGSGVTGGETLLQNLAKHPSTAEHICIKLIELLVNDNKRLRSDPLVTACKNTFLANSNNEKQITEVIKTILNSTEFKSDLSFKSKIQTPLEFSLSKLRKLNNPDRIWEVASFIEINDYALFEMPIPTGYKETGHEWLNSSFQLLQRLYLNNNFSKDYNSIDYYIKLIQENTDSSLESFIEFSEDYLIGDKLSEEEKTELSTILGGDDFDLENYDKIGEALRFIQDLPKAHLN